jgi:hypothetical protein
MLSALLVIAMAEAALPAGTSGPVAMTARQIRTYNAALSRDDPAYIRCERQLETGSLVKKTRLCRTNAEWRRVGDIANDTARDMQERYLQHSFSASQEPTGP